MRLWLLALTLVSLLLLPFAGASASIGNLWAQSMHGMGTTLISEASAVEHHIDANARESSGDAEYDHCAAMAAAANAHAQSNDENSQSSASCCDNHDVCDTECASDCGHCVVSGHGCSAATAGIQILAFAFAQQNIRRSTPTYSLLLVQGTPPPIIA